jgi:hypothetical protein
LIESRTQSVSFAERLFLWPDNAAKATFEFFSEFFSTSLDLLTPATDTPFIETN